MASTGVDRVNGIDPFVAFKAPCKVATTANVTLSGAQTIDGVSVSETTPKTRVLVRSQTNSTENGIYDVYDTSWVRSSDFNGTRDIVDSTLVSVDSGTSYSGTTWRVQATNPVVIGITSISFVLSGEFSTAAGTASSYAVIRAYNNDTTFNTVILKDDVIGGSFWKDLTDTTSADNGGTIIVDTVGGRWKRIFSGVLHMEWFESPQNAVDAGYKVVELPDGTTNISQLKIPSEITIRGKGTDKSFLSSSFNGPILVSKNYFSSESLSPTGDVRLEGFSIVGDAASALQEGILLREYYSTIEWVNVYNTKTRAIRFTHLDDAATPVGGNLVNNRVMHVRTSGTGAVELGADDNNKITDGVAEDIIVGIHSTSDYALYIGSSAGWFVDKIHTEGTAAVENSVYISNAFATNIGTMYCEGNGKAGKAVVNFTKIQYGLHVDSLNIPLTTATAIGVSAGKSGSVASADLSINSLTIRNTAATAVTGVSIATSTVRAKIGAKAYTTSGGGTITDSYSSQVSRSEASPEFGTWSPLVKGNTTAGTYTTTSVTANYVKTGGRVEVFFDISFSAASGGTGALAIYNLPYTYSASTNGYGGITATSLDLVNANPASIGLIRATASADDRIIVAETKDNAAFDTTLITGVSTSTRLIGKFEYFTNS